MTIYLQLGIGSICCKSIFNPSHTVGLRCLPQAIANLTDNIEVQCSITTDDVTTSAVCVYDDQPAEECRFCIMNIELSIANIATILVWNHVHRPHVCRLLKQIGSICHVCMVL